MSPKEAVKTEGLIKNAAFDQATIDVSSPSCAEFTAAGELGSPSRCTGGKRDATLGHS